MKGTITRDVKTKEWILIDYDNNTWQELPIHPYYSKYDEWKQGMVIDYQYSLECSSHFPKVCTCRDLKMYATPIFPPKKGIIAAIKSFFS